MKSKFVIVMVFIVATLSIIVQAQTSQEIVMEYKRTENIPQNADILINKLEEEVREIVDAGHLMPFRMQYGEDPRYYPVPSHENEFDEPWAMMFTLARAYPYVSNDLKTQIIDYIRNENDLHAPWLDSALGPTGFYRQGDPVGLFGYTDMQLMIGAIFNLNGVTCRQSTIGYIQVIILMS